MVISCSHFCTMFLHAGLKMKNAKLDGIGHQTNQINVQTPQKTLTNLQTPPQKDPRNLRQKFKLTFTKETNHRIDHTQRGKSRNRSLHRDKLISMRYFTSPKKQQTRSPYCLRHRVYFYTVRYPKPPNK